jgi:hypothetical protein
MNIYNCICRQMKIVKFIFIYHMKKKTLCFLDKQIDHLIRCDLQEILIDPHHHINHERFVGFYFIDFD